MKVKPPYHKEGTEKDNPDWTGRAGDRCLRPNQNVQLGGKSGTCEKHGKGRGPSNIS